MCPLARMPSLPHILTTPITSVCFFSVIFNLVLFYFYFILFTYLFIFSFFSPYFFLFVFCFIPADWVLQGRRSNQAVYTCIRASNLYLLTTCFVPVIFSCPYSFDPHLLGLKNAPRDYQGVCSRDGNPLVDGRVGVRLMLRVDWTCWSHWVIIKSYMSLLGWKKECIKTYTGVPYKVYNSVPVLQLDGGVCSAGSFRKLY